ncbi:MAG: Fluoroquinolones export ATP-binding protein [Dehalococcoides mccartyi]|nr:Fluoroquinolones export ATP-binding protein [Dehalococcoides mccartyi]
MSQISISVEKLSYWYGDLKAVNGISFEVGQGEILGFLGPNGAGKTTTQKMLTGQLKPKDGRATLLGFDVAKDTEEIHRRIGICFEQTNLYEQMTALENLQLFADLFGVKNFDGYALLKRVGLAGR